jgi:hypothetical protein
MHHSRPNSPKSVLSGLTWQQGPTAFFSQGVPFSYGVGKTLAARIYNAYLLLNPTPAPPQGGENSFNSGASLRTTSCDQPHTPEQKHTPSPSNDTPPQNSFNSGASLRTASCDQPQAPLKIGLEIGAGLGYLSKHCLDLLPSTVSWTVSDASSALVTHWQTAHTFATHPQVSLAIRDLENPFSWPEPLDMILMSYVLDSTPTCHMEWDNGHLYEWVIHTEIETQDMAIYSTDRRTDMHHISAQDLWAQWDQYPAADQPWLAPRLSTLCNETWQRIPAIDSPYLSADDCSFMMTFLTETAAPKVIFNYAPIIRKRLAEFIAALSPTGMIALHDFGYQSADGAKQNSDLCTQFNAIQAYPIHFPLIAWIAKKANAYCAISPAPEGESALCLISKHPLPDTWQDTDSRYTQAHTLQTQLDTLNETHARTWTNTDKASITNDYAIMSQLAQLNETTKMYWLEKAITTYPDLAIPSYSQYAEWLIQRGDPSAAKAVLRNATERFPLDPTLALGLANICIREKEWAKALAILKKTVPKLSPPLLTHSVKMMGLLQG